MRKQLETQAFNYKAISFYKKNGFHIIGFDRYRLPFMPQKIWQYKRETSGKRRRTAGSGIPFRLRDDRRTDLQSRFPGWPPSHIHRYWQCGLSDPDRSWLYCQRLRKQVQRRKHPQFYAEYHENTKRKKAAAGRFQQFRFKLLLRSHYRRPVLTGIITSWIRNASRKIIMITRAWLWRRSIWENTDRWIKMNWLLVKEW